MDVRLSAHFATTAENWADDLMGEFGQWPEDAIRDLVDRQILPRMVAEVCQACDREGIRRPDLQESYAKRAVAKFDRRLDHMLVKRQQAATTVH